MRTPSANENATRGNPKRNGASLLSYPIAPRNPPWSFQITSRAKDAIDVTIRALLEAFPLLTKQA